MTQETDRPGCNIAQALALARLVLRFGQVRRVTLHEDGERESDTTHTVMLALLAIEVAARAGYDAGLAVQFAVVHDLPEAYAGDTNTARGLSAEEASAKAAKEAAAMERLEVEHGGARWLDLLRRYEMQQEPEARLVRYLDKVMPKLTHFANRGAALAAMGLTVSDVRAKHANGACELVERGIRSGDLRVAEAPVLRG